MLYLTVTTSAGTPGAPTWGPQRPSAPVVVWLAVATTWLAAGATVLVTAVLTAGVLFLGGPVAEAFETPQWWLWVLAIAAATVACCLCAAIIARGVLRGSNAARWALVAGSALTVLFGAMTFYYIWPALVALAALVVFTLLLLPDTGKWTRN